MSQMRIIVKRSEAALVKFHTHIKAFFKSSMSRLPLSTSDVKQEVAIRKGDGHFYNLPAMTVMECFDAAVKKYGDKPALHQKLPAKGIKLEDTPFTTWTWKEYRAQVDAFAKSLISLGFEPFDVINIIGFNSSAWFVANFGAIAAGGVAAGIYATNLSDACKYISEHSESKVVVCEGLKQLEKYYSIASDLPNLKAVVVYHCDEIPADVKQSLPSVAVYTFAEFLTLGEQVADEVLVSRANEMKPGHTCTLIYTSGTTGPPKAVMITHDNITWTVRLMLTYLPGGKLDNNDHIVSFLPVSHIAAQMLDLHIPMQTGAQCHFAQPDALKGSLVTTLKAVRPTIFFAVPRVWEKFYDKLQEIGKSSTGIKKVLSTWAKAQALKHWESLEFGSKTGGALLYPLAKKLLRQVHVALGLDRCNSFFVSAAPIEVKILKYFLSIDLPVMEIFGQSECTGPHASNRREAFKLGSVGRPMPGTETMLAPENGELCYRGRHIFAGYMNMDEKTKETVDADGWMRSGDVAKIDDDHDPNIPKPSGFISITGRLKELIITGGGENVPPVLIEDQFKIAIPALSNCMVVGDKRKFLTILLCLRVDIDEDGTATNKLTGRALETSKEIGSNATTTDEVRSDPLWKEYLDKGMETANQAATSSAQIVGKWGLLSTDFTEKGGELTPTLKLKRFAAVEIHKETIEAMYTCES